MEQNGKPEEKSFNPEADVQEFNPPRSNESLSETGEGPSGGNIGINQEHGNLGQQIQLGGAFVPGQPSIRFAGFWMRFWAFLLDLIVVGSIGRLIAIPVFRLLGIEPSNGLFSAHTVVSAVIFYVYFVLMTKFFRQTLGKMVFGLVVISLKNGRLSWMDVLFREWIGRFISQTIMVLYFIPAFHPKKQGLHDIFADTAVIHSNR